MQQLLLGLFVRLAGVIGFGVNGALGQMTALITKGFRAAVKFHEEGIAFARDFGLNAKEAQAYTQALTERTAELASKYGVTAEAIKEVQRNIVDATGKQYMLNDAEAEYAVQINKLVGAGTAKIFDEQIMNKMGGTLSSTQGAISKAYATAAKSGLSTAKFSETVARNLSMANRLNFRNGVDGITKMAAMAEKFGLDMKSVETAANKFMELDEAIETSAHLQMLGGSIGAAFGNPLENAYEAQYDPEAFAKRTEDAIKGMATFDREKGYATVSPMNQNILKEYANKMGLNPEDVIGNAKKQAEVRYKETAFAPELAKLKTQEQRDFILNKSYIDAATNHLMFTDTQGKSHDLSKNGIDDKVLEEMMKFNDMSDRDIMESQASTLTNINEQLKGIGESFVASIAQYLNKYIPGLTTSLKNFAREIQPKVVEIGKNIGDLTKKVLDFLRNNKDTIKSVAKGIFGVTAWLTKHWPLLVGLWAGKKLLGASIGGTSLGGRLASKAASGAWSGIKFGAKGLWKGAKLGARGAWKGLKAGAKGAKWLGGKALQGAKAVGKKGYDILGKGGANHSWKQAKNYARNAFRMTNGNALNKTLHGAKSLWRNSKALRASVKGGAAILGVAGNMATDYLVDKGKIKRGGAVHYGAKMASTAAEYGALGATIGSVIPGLGTAVGGGIGAAVGAIKGAYDTWKSLPENADKNFIDYSKTCVKGMWEGMKNVGSSMLDSASSVFSSVGDAMKERGGVLKSIGNLIIAPIRGIITFFEKLMHPIDTIMSIWQKIQNFFNADYKGKWEMIKNAAADMAFGSREKHAAGGIVGGNSYSGDKVLAGLNSGEMVLNRDQQAQLFAFIGNATSILTKLGSSNGVSYYSAKSLNDVLSTVFNSNSNIISTALNADNGLKTKPFGENSFRKIPVDRSNLGSNVSEITIKNTKFDISGTIKLDGGNNSKNVNIKELLNDSAFVNSLKNMIKESINNDMNGGRFMNDNASLRGSVSTATYWR